MYLGTQQRAAQAYESICLKRLQVDQKWTTEERELFVRGAQTVSKKDTKMIVASAFRYLNGHKTEVMHDPVSLRAT